MRCLRNLNSPPFELCADEGNPMFRNLVLGYALVAIVFLLQPTMQAVCKAHACLRRLLAADAYILMAVWAAVNIWRGIWALLDRQFLPSRGPLGLWLYHGGALALLKVLRCSNSLLVRGVWLDGEEAGGSCVAFSVTVNK